MCVRMHVCMYLCTYVYTPICKISYLLYVKHFLRSQYSEVFKSIDFGIIVQTPLSCVTLGK